MNARGIARLAQPLSRTSRLSTTTTSQQTRTLSSAAARRAATHDDGHHGGHDSHYDPPGGWLWGERPGEKYEKEGWEYPFYIGYCGSLILAIVAYSMKEDTSIQTWALEEATRRLEKEGILEDKNPA